MPTSTEPPSQYRSLVVTVPMPMELLFIAPYVPYRIGHTIDVINVEMKIKKTLKNVKRWRK